MSHRGAAAGLLLVTFALAGCGSSGNDVAQDPATTSSAPTSSDAAPTIGSTVTSSAGAAQCPGNASTAPGPLITLDKPADGGAVSGTFEASGTANSPEANVPWIVFDASKKVVLKGHFTAEGWMDKLYPYSGSVDVSSLAPGDYTFMVSVDNEADSGEGSSGSTDPCNVGRDQAVVRHITVS